MEGFYQVVDSQENENLRNRTWGRRSNQATGFILDRLVLRCLSNVNQLLGFGRQIQTEPSALQRFFVVRAMSRVLVPPPQGSNSYPLHQELRVLTPGLQGSPQMVFKGMRAHEITKGVRRDKRQALGALQCEELGRWRGTHKKEQKKIPVRWEEDQGLGLGDT